MVLFYNVPSPVKCNNTNVYNRESNIIKYTEKISPLAIKENNCQICNSLTGVCAPPPDWYTTD